MGNTKEKNVKFSSKFVKFIREKTKLWYKLVNLHDTNYFFDYFFNDSKTLNIYFLVFHPIP